MSADIQTRRYFAFIPVVNGFDLLAKAVASVADYGDEAELVSWKRDSDIWIRE